MVLKVVHESDCPSKWREPCICDADYVDADDDADYDDDLWLGDDEYGHETGWGE